jgi:pimeloyl-ACP methyl ester carboxylesterase
MKEEIAVESGWLALGRQSLEVRHWRLAGARGTIVLIHEALGSASYWKDFPIPLAQSSGMNVVAYSRAGHGDSDGPLEPRAPAYYERQVDVVLPRLMEEFRIAEPVLYGHSEGTAIAFLYAAAGKPVRAIIAESPIVLSEKKTLEAVNELDQPQARAELVERLSRYHRDAAAVFASWVEAARGHLAREFPAGAYLSHVRCPVLTIEGELDQYCSPAQSAVLEASLPDLQRVLLPGTGHLPHRERPEAVFEAVRGFLQEIDSRQPSDNQQGTWDGNTRLSDSASKRKADS